MYCRMSQVFVTDSCHYLSRTSEEKQYVSQDVSQDVSQGGGALSWHVAGLMVILHQHSILTHQVYNVFDVSEHI